MMPPTLAFALPSFAAPWVLLALAALPLLWWLLRVTPPAPRHETFPALRLLIGLTATAETPARTPWWLLLLRMLAAGLIIVALARPVLESGGDLLPGGGKLLLVVDDGWAAAADWPRRMTAAEAALDRAEHAGRRVGLLTTAPGETGAPPAATPDMPVPEARTRLAALRPKPWPVDRAAAAAALRDWAGKGAALYLADGTTGGTGWDGFAAALEAVGPVEVLRDPVAAARLLLPPRTGADQLVAHVAEVPRDRPAEAAVLAQTGDGRTLARAVAVFAPGAAEAEAPIALPPELRNRLGRLVLEGQSSAGAVLLLDERWRRRPVGLLAGDAAAATPLTGSLYYLRRALEDSAEVRQGDLAQLLARELSVLIVADASLAEGPQTDALAAWVEQGGLLLRFAGPRLAEHPDTLLPVKLLAGDRQFGGAMSWSQPAGLAPFPSASPFAGLAVPDEVKVTRQVLAEPGAQLSEASWARLADGTPLVTQATRGAGRIVLFHVTANADWSDLPLSGLFVEMLRRLVAVSAGVVPGEDANGPPLAPAETLDGFGQPGPPPPAATALPARDLAGATASPRHPPGLYGPENGRRALNLSNRMAAPQAAAPIPGAREASLAGAAPERALAPWLMAAALALLAIDLLVSLRLRGLLRAAALLVLLLAAPSAAHAAAPEPNPALSTRLGYIVSGDAQIDQVSRAGLAGLSELRQPPHRGQPRDPRRGGAGAG